MSVSRIRARYVTTIPKSLRNKSSVNVGDDMLWLPLTEKEFLTIILPSNRYKALSQLLKGVQLSKEAKEKAEKVYFNLGGKKVL